MHSPLQQMGSTPVIENQCESHIRTPEHPIIQYPCLQMSYASITEHSNPEKVVDHTSGWFPLVSDYDLPLQLALQVAVWGQTGSSLIIRDTLTTVQLSGGDH